MEASNKSTHLNEVLENDLLSQIAHQLSHDIGNPLTSIITYGSLIEQAGQLNIPHEKLSSYAKSMLLETWKISGLVEKFLLLVSTKPTHGSIKLKDLSSKIMSRYQGRLGLNAFDLELEGFDSDLTIQADPEQLSSILCELLTNSANALNLLSIDNQEIEKTLKLRVQQENEGFIQITSSNLTPEHQASLTELMQPGFSEMPGGKTSVGIGLPAIYNTAKRWKGDFRISKEKRGEQLYFISTLILPTLENI